MRHIIREHSVFAALIILLLIINAFSWSSLFIHRSKHPDDATLFGTFGTSNIVNSAVYATFDSEKFYIYHGQSTEFLDQGVWSQSNSTAILTGQAGTYDLVIHGNSIYLVGGTFERITQLNKLENTPIFIHANMDKS